MVYLILEFGGTLDSNMVNAVAEDVQALPAGTVITTKFNVFL